MVSRQILPYVGRFSIAVCSVLLLRTIRADESPTIELSDIQHQKCIELLRRGVAADEFWPSMHAAEALTLAGEGDDVRRLLTPRLATESDGQHRCGLARELVRAGDRIGVSVLLETLAQQDPYAHGHACESLYKVNAIGDGRLLRAAMQQTDDTRLMLMAAAALGRWGNPNAFSLLRAQVNNEDPELARIAAWILARIGDGTDIPLLRGSGKRFQDPITRAYFDHALATLGDPDGLVQLTKNLTSSDAALRTYAATFAGDARATSVKLQLLKLLDDSNQDVRVRAAQSLLVLSKPALADESLGFARDVFQASEDYPRYSEGSVLALRDGTLLYATTEFIGSGSDFATARIVASRSNDGGRSWTEQCILQENVGEKNVMSVTLRRLDAGIQIGGTIGLFFLIKNGTDDLKVFLRVSRDEGMTFGKPILVTNRPGYHVLNNDRVTRLNSGRLLVPVASTSDASKSNHYVASCFISDDQGQTWRPGTGQVDYARRGAMEPEVLELRDGRILMIVRTQLGHIAFSHSADGGDSWSPLKSWGVRAPEAPATLRRIPSTGDLILVWNDIYESGAGHGGKRTPLTVAISRDEGKTWGFRQDLEESAAHTFAYTSLTFFAGRAILTYYVRDEATRKISSRFRSIPIKQLYGIYPGRE